MGLARDAAPAGARGRRPGCSVAGRGAGDPLGGGPLAHARPRRHASTSGRAVLVERLANGPATRAQLREALAAAGVDASGQRLPHLVRRAALEGLRPPSARRHLRRARAARPAAARRGAGRARPPLRRRLRPRERGRPRRVLGPPGGRGPHCTHQRRYMRGVRPSSHSRSSIRLLGPFDPYLLGYKGQGARGGAGARPAGVAGRRVAAPGAPGGRPRRPGRGGSTAARSTSTRSGRYRRRRSRPRSPTSRASWAMGDFARSVPWGRCRADAGRRTHPKGMRQHFRGCGWRSGAVRCRHPRCGVVESPI